MCKDYNINDFRRLKNNINLNINPINVQKGWKLKCFGIA